MRYIKIFQPKLAETTDGAGNSYKLVETMPLFDCARCKKACTRRTDLNIYADKPVSAIGGHLFDVFGQARPYCHQCYLIERGLLQK